MATTVPAVYLVGVDRLALIPEYLNLGSVVIVAPDAPTLRAWQQEQDPPSAKEQGDPPVVVDMQGRRIVHEGASLPLSDKEFLMLGPSLTNLGGLGPSERFAASGGRTPASCPSTPTLSRQRSSVFEPSSRSPVPRS